jgi:hypothetical protein
MIHFPILTLRNFAELIHLLQQEYTSHLQDTPKHEATIKKSSMPFGVNVEIIPAECQLEIVDF